MSTHIQQKERMKMGRVKRIEMRKCQLKDQSHSTTKRGDMNDYGS